MFFKQKINILSLLTGLTAYIFIGERLLLDGSWRSFLVVLTEAGEELKKTLTDKMEILFAGLLENTSDEDLAVFLGILDRINGNIANNTTS
ncbi:hypothetical protein ACWNPK_03585 [Bacillus atrophaeus]